MVHVCQANTCKEPDSAEACWPKKNTVVRVCQVPPMMDVYVRFPSLSLLNSFFCFSLLLSVFCSLYFLCVLQVEEGQTVLVMQEPDLAEDMDGWSEWYKNITEAADRLKMEMDERF